MQYPQKDFYFGNNPNMDISTTIAANLTAWMEGGSGPSTLKELSRRSGVGFGTVQRAKNASGNTTIQNLEAIAKAFGKSAINLLTDQTGPYATHLESGRVLTQRENKAPVYNFNQRDDDKLILETVALMRAMDKEGKQLALKHVKLVAEVHAKASKTIKVQ